MAIATAALLLVGLMMAAGAMVQATAPSCQTGTPTATGTTYTVQCKDVLGPGVVEHKQLASVGLGFCLAPGSLVLACDAALGNPSGAGAAFFSGANRDNTGSVPWTSVVRYVYFNAWTTFTEANCVDASICGFTLNVCNDWDLNSLCTNTVAGDQNFEDYSNDPIIGEKCGDPDAKKNTKGTCANGLEAEVGPVCLERASSGTWDTDAGGNSVAQIVVFIGNYVSNNPWADYTPFGGPDLGRNGNIGAGIALGTFHVHMRDDGTPAACDVVGERSPDKIFDPNPISNSCRLVDEAPSPGGFPEGTTVTCSIVCVPGNFANTMASTPMGGALLTTLSPLDVMPAPIVGGAAAWVPMPDPKPCIIAGNYNPAGNADGLCSWTDPTGGACSPMALIDRDVGTVVKEGNAVCRFTVTIPIPAGAAVTGQCTA